VIYLLFIIYVILILKYYIRQISILIMNFRIMKIFEHYLLYIEMVLWVKLFWNVIPVPQEMFLYWVSFQQKLTP